MRIITGDFRGRRLNAPINDDIRPTTDKVKEAMFNLLMGYIEDSVILDLFCGTGNLGLEALSRGAAKCYFCDSSRESIVLTGENIEYCKAQERSVILPGDYKKNLDRIKESVDIVFLDPPYKSGLLADCIQRISEKDIMSKGGMIIAEHSVKDRLEEQIGRFTKIKERKYGLIEVTIYG